MRIGIISVHTDYHRRGAHYRGIVQPQVGPLIAALLPSDVEIDVINDAWEEPNWERDYDLLFISSLHADFDRARQVSHYWRRRGAKTVFGGTLASTYSAFCAPFFDTVSVGDAEGTVPRIYEDFRHNKLQPLYVSLPYDPALIPTPRFDLMARKQPLPIALEATRGCPFACEFCALTGIGTRYHVRPIDTVLRDIREGQRMLDGAVPSYKLKAVLFVDNNIGGNFAYLRALCDALAPLKIVWAGAITLNAVANLEIVRMLSRAGCRGLFVGLESFNPKTISDMHKFQNGIKSIRTVIDQCRKHGILVESGLLLSPLVDDLGYMEAVPEYLHDCGLHKPSFIAFESPIPGTPHYYRVASMESCGFLPNALLRDFTGYTLVTNPVHHTVLEFIDGYKSLLKKTYSLSTTIRKLADDLPTLLLRGYGTTALFDFVTQCPKPQQPDTKRGFHPGDSELRTYVAFSDTPPPEPTKIPFQRSDFRSEDERTLIMEPCRVTDSTGRTLPAWQRSVKLFDAKGQISDAARQLGDPVIRPQAALG